MGKVVSNTFDLEDYLSNITEDIGDEIINDLDTKINEDVYRNPSSILKSKCEEFRKNISIDYTKSEIIDIDKSNFSDNQYNLLKHKAIGVKVDDEIYHFLTPDKIIYRISDVNLINIILNTPRPRKIVYDKPCESSSTYSMQLLANILEDIKSSSLQQLIASYGYEFKDEYSSLFILLDIYNIYEKLIYKYEYNNYINYEHKKYKIFNNISLNIDPDLHDSRIEECTNEIQSLAVKLNLESCISENIHEFLNQITLLSDNDLVYPSTNPELLNCINLNDYNKLLELINEISYLKNINQNIIDTYNNACIKSPTPLVSKVTNRIIIKGTYQHLFQNIITEILNVPEYINFTNEDKNLLQEILISKGIDVKKNVIILLEWALMAYINGANTLDEYKQYFYYEKNTILSDDDIKYILNILDNNLNDLKKYIDEEENKIYTGNLIVHGNFKTFKKLYLNTERKLVKELILEVDSYLKDFNKQNKSKIYFLGYSDGIYLSCEDESLNVAIDTLSRTMVSVYDKFLKKTKAYCYIENLNM